MPPATTSQTPDQPTARPGEGAPLVAIIGAGPAGLIAAEMLSARGAAVTVYERMPSPARKLLMAGRGGLNITHAEALDRFKGRYGLAASRLAPMIDAFPPERLIAWARSLAQETFVGSSGRVFPRAMKASPLLRAWLARLQDQGVTLVTRAEWRGWAPDGALSFAGAAPQRADAVLLALGGASWPRLGSAGDWVGLLRDRGVEVAPFQPANCGFDVAWSDTFRERFAGAPLKPVVLSFEGQAVRGEAMVTAYGLEGGAVYALSSHLRDAIARDGRAVLTLDLRPDLSEPELARRLARPRDGQSASTFLRKAAGLSPLAVNLVREVHGGGLPSNLAAAIKALPLTLDAPRGLERAISSAGGVSWSSVDADMMLKAAPGVFVAGEMLDWEAPTGGYLLQACFATGAAAAEGISRLLGLTPDGDIKARDKRQRVD